LGHTANERFDQIGADLQMTVFAQLLASLRQVERHYDLYGDLQIDHYDFQLNPGSKMANGLILYNGVWSGGVGFYFAENSTPATDCPSMAGKLNEVIAELGGHAGNI